MNMQRFSVIPTLAVLDCEMPANVLRSFAALCALEGGGGEYKSVIRTLAEACDARHATIIRHLKWLEERGYITRRQNANGESIVRVKLDYHRSGGMGGEK